MMKMMKLGKLIALCSCTEALRLSHQAGTGKGGAPNLSGKSGKGKGATTKNYAQIKAENEERIKQAAADLLAELQESAAAFSARAVAWSNSDAFLRVQTLTQEAQQLQREMCSAEEGNLGKVFRGAQLGFAAQHDDTPQFKDLLQEGCDALISGYSIAAWNELAAFRYLTGDNDEAVVKAGSPIPSMVEVAKQNARKASQIPDNFSLESFLPKSSLCILEVERMKASKKVFAGDWTLVSKPGQPASMKESVESDGGREQALAEALRLFDELSKLVLRAKGFAISRNPYGLKARKTYWDWRSEAPSPEKDAVVKVTECLASASADVDANAATLKVDSVIAAGKGTDATIAILNKMWSGNEQVLISAKEAVYDEIRIVRDHVVNRSQLKALEHSLKSQSGAQVEDKYKSHSDIILGGPNAMNSFNIMGALTQGTNAEKRYQFDSWTYKAHDLGEDDYEAVQSYDITFVFKRVPTVGDALRDDSIDGSGGSTTASDVELEESVLSQQPRKSQFANKNNSDDCKQ